MNARPGRRFLFALAGHLGMTVGQLETEMDSHEFSEWLVYAQYFQPLDNSWLQAGLITSAALAPYSRKGHAPKVSDFYPVDKPPQHTTQLNDVLRRMKEDLDGK